MKKTFLVLGVGMLVCVFAVACSEPAEPVLPLPEGTELVAGETGTFVSEEQAAQVAEAFFLDRAGDALKTRSAAGALESPASVGSIRSDAGDPVVHVLNYPDGGFALVSATRDYHPVLAWSDEGSFELTPDMGPVEVWLAETKEAIRTVKALDADTKASIRAEWGRLDPAGAAVSVPKTRAGYYDPQLQDAFIARRNQLHLQGWHPLLSLEEARDYLPSSVYDRMCIMASAESSPVEYTLVGVKNEYVYRQVGPLMTTRWHQKKPFNDLCNDKPAGCATIALAQIMKFFEEPTSHNGHVWDWSNITSTSPPSGNHEELALFVRSIGFELGINYVIGDSGATANDSKRAFEAFGYNATLSNHNPGDVINWVLNHQTPVSMGGYTSNFLGLPTGEGHRWVCDGARTGETRTTFFVEFIRPGTNRYFDAGCWSPSYPGEISEPDPAYFYHNWGWGGDRDGWFAINNVNSGYGNFQYVRKNIYAKPR